MTKNEKINIKKIRCRKYKIIIGNKSLEKINEFVKFNKYSKVFIISEKKIYNLWKDKINKIHNNINVILLKTGEKTKSMESVQYICEKLIDFGADRKSLIINIGGGMITDLGGFSSSIYMRGVDYINIPTSLLAMIDASIGGKNGVNLNSVKNIIGVFNEPKIIIIDTEFLQTLPEREYNSAYGEIIKHSIIRNKKYFNKLEKYGKNYDINNIILNSLKIKRYFVQKDFKEKNIRKILNFGHTIGHSIESISMDCKQPILHGEAIVVGMFLETKIAEKNNLISKKNADKIYKLLNNFGLKDLIKYIEKNKKTFNTKELINKMKKDKKNVKNKIKMVLPLKIGKCKYDIYVNENDILKCFSENLKLK